MTLNLYDPGKGIGWCDGTWNWEVGCAKVSERFQCPGCQLVHAESEREDDGEGHLVCPDCGERSALTIDELVDSPR